MYIFFGLLFASNLFFNNMLFVHVDVLLICSEIMAFSLLVYCAFSFLSVHVATCHRLSKFAALCYNLHLWKYNTKCFTDYFCKCHLMFITRPAMFVTYWHCLLSMQSTVYEMVRCPSVCLSGLLLWAWRAGDIDWLLQQWWANAGSALLSVYICNWPQTCRFWLLLLLITASGHVMFIVELLYCTGNELLFIALSSKNKNYHFDLGINFYISILSFLHSRCLFSWLSTVRK